MGVLNFKSLLDERCGFPELIQTSITISIFKKPLRVKRANKIMRLFKKISGSLESSI